MADEALAALREAHERTLAAGTAWVQLDVDHTFELPAWPTRRSSGLLAPLTRAAKAGARRLFEEFVAGSDFTHQRYEGVLDLRERRYMMDLGSFARLFADGEERMGRSGRALKTLPATFFPSGSPLWLVDLLAGVTDARKVGTDDVRGAACRRLAATADLGRASAATPGGMTLRTRGTFDELLALPVDVWIDDSHLRRIGFSAENTRETLELWDFGVPVAELDWSRLPTFRSPEEAIWVAERGP